MTFVDSDYFKVKSVDFFTISYIIIILISFPTLGPSIAITLLY